MADRENSGCFRLSTPASNNENLDTHIQQEQSRAWVFCLAEGAFPGAISDLRDGTKDAT